MIGGLLAALAGSAWMRTGLRYGVIALAILLFLLSLRRSGERAGRLTEQLETMEKTYGLARKKWRASAEEPGGVLWETGIDLRRSFGVKRCGWH